MSKLLKLSDTHYIIVDDSEIKEGDCYCFDKVDRQIWFGNFESMEKITHSTQPLEPSLRSDDNTLKDFVFIKPLSLSEVEEVINGYSVEKMAEKFVIEKLKISSQAPGVMIGYIEGFKAHQELVKDKFILSKDQIEMLIEQAREHHGYMELEKSKQYLFEAISPKTEWDVEFDEQGKIVLL
jgi:hypothetical protein